jgi:protein TonB
MIDQEREGSADIECTILPDGHTSNCQLVSTKGGDAFGRAAMAYVVSAQYKPAFRNGKPITEEHHRLHIVFRLSK